MGAHADGNFVLLQYAEDWDCNGHDWNDSMERLSGFAAADANKTKSSFRVTEGGVTKLPPKGVSSVNKSWRTVNTSTSAKSEDDVKPADPLSRPLSFVYKFSL